MNTKTPSESAVRQKASRQGLILRKCRSRTPENPAFGTFHLVEADRNIIALGDWNTGYGCTLEECNDYLNAPGSNQS